MREPARAADAVLLVDNLAARHARQDDQQHQRDDEEQNDKFEVVHDAVAFPVAPDDPARLSGGPL